MDSKLNLEQSSAPSSIPLEFFVFKKVIAAALPKNSGLTSLAGQTIDIPLTESDIENSKIDIEQNMSEDAQGLTGYKKYIDLLTKDTNETYYAGDYMYKMFTVAVKNKPLVPQTLEFKKRLIRETEEENVTPWNSTSFPRTNPDYKGVYISRFLRIIIWPTTDDERKKTKELIKFQVDDIAAMELDIKYGF